MGDQALNYSLLPDADEAAMSTGGVHTSRLLRLGVLCWKLIVVLAIGLLTVFCKICKLKTGF